MIYISLSDGATYDTDNPAHKSAIERTETLRHLRSTDAKLPRALEDLIDLLVQKRVIAKNELPAAVTAALDEKKALRGKL